MKTKRIWWSWKLFCLMILPYCSVMLLAVVTTGEFDRLQQPQTYFGLVTLLLLVVSLANAYERNQ